MTLRGVMTPGTVGVMTPEPKDTGICAACGQDVAIYERGRAAHHTDQSGKDCMGWGSPVKPKFVRAKKGDIFQTPEGAVVRVTRASKDGRWADVVVIDNNFATWSKRMPLGIPVAWKRLPRR